MNIVLPKNYLETSHPNNINLITVAFGKQENEELKKLDINSRTSLTGLFKSLNERYERSEKKAVNLNAKITAWKTKPNKAKLEGVMLGTVCLVSAVAIAALAYYAAIPLMFRICCSSHIEASVAGGFMLPILLGITLSPLYLVPKGIYTIFMAVTGKQHTSNINALNSAKEKSALNRKIFKQLNEGVTQTLKELNNESAIDMKTLSKQEVKNTELVKQIYNRLAVIDYLKDIAK